MGKNRGGLLIRLIKKRGVNKKRSSGYMSKNDFFVKGILWGKNLSCEYIQYERSA